MKKGDILFDDLLPNLFRSEYAKITAVLCRYLGLEHIEVAEDIASETFLKASESWITNGIPENPAAWLYTVAKNKTKDYLKRVKVFETRVKEAAKTEEFSPEKDFEFNNQNITDSQLAMIFAVCNPANSAEAQISLALQILCGFSVEEIANAFLTKAETVKKRLQRARERLRKDNFQIKALGKTEIQSRLGIVQKSLYLLFNEGYFSISSNQSIRKELCSEAVRLTLMLTENHLTNTPQTNALLALMCFQSSRLDARTNDKGETILFEEQNKNSWDTELIEKGNYYLVEAFSDNKISKYHLEAAIAYWHTTTDKSKWSNILQLYNQLVMIEYSPITAMNRTFAYAKVYGNEKALFEAEKLEPNGNIYFHELLGYLNATINIDEAINHYEKAFELTKSETEKQTLRREIERLKYKRNP